ncbi:L,D-transpeptidase family protein [Methylomonas sp. AM2-LC]|uniref:L,D-transpeptidase family protein n=1 Tax=Methylomonas sp. AM2-LC TaxID=3153301 RepID=UPI0032633489
MAVFINGCQLLPFSQEPEPQQVVWTVKADEVVSHEFTLQPNQNLVGSLASVQARDNDTLSDIARHYGLGFNDIAYANAGMDPWTLHNTQSVILPLRFILPEAPHHGIVLNLATMRMFVYPKTTSNMLFTFPVGVGREGWNTPLGLTKIISKKVNPDWIVPESIKREHIKQGDPLPNVIHAGPDNPLGNYAMHTGFNSILIHGTNKPYGIGMQVSHGCVQLYPEDIESLFNKVEVGTPVRIVHQPYLVAWDNDMLYLEAHPPLEKWQKQQTHLQADLKVQLKKIAAEKHTKLDWLKVADVLKRADGIPTPVLVNGENLYELTAHAIPLQHPDQLANQPQVVELKDSDWSLLTDRFPSASEAQKLAAMLNHLEPQIPARMVASAGGYQVIAGPFKTSKETQQNAKRIKQFFELDVTARPPKKSVG